jgi:ADP-heptose:LPS heptosyltransferase
MKVMNPTLVRFAKRIDRVWSLLAFTSRYLQSPSAQPSKPLNILVLELHLIGDAVMLLPFLQALRRRYPTAFITVVVGPWNQPILANETSVNSVIEFSAPWVRRQGFYSSFLALYALFCTLRNQSWDIGIDMRGDIRNILILFFARCMQRYGFDFTGGGSLLTCVVPDDGSLDSLLGHHERLAESLDAFDGKRFVPQMRLSKEEYLIAQATAKYVGFHFGASLALRRLPIEEAVMLIRECLIAFKEPAILFDAPGLESYITELLAYLDDDSRKRIEVWRGDLRSFMVVSTRAHILFAMDSGPAHIAAATGCPTVVLFGPNRSEWTGPRGTQVTCVELVSPMPCQPCDQHHCIHPVTSQACLKGLVPRAVAAGKSFFAGDTTMPASRVLSISAEPTKE